MPFNLPDCDMEEPEIEDVSCAVEEQTEEEECPICSHNAGEFSIIQRMNQVELNLTGTVSSEEIYRLQHQLYEHQVRQPLLRQGRVCPEITINHIRTHYQRHKLNLKDIVSKEILFVNTMQKHFRSNQIATKNLTTGEKKLNLKGVDQWVKLSKHKLDLIKYYHGPLTKSSKAKGSEKQTKIKPYEFT